MKEGRRERERERERERDKKKTRVDSISANSLICALKATFFASVSQSSLRSSNPFAIVRANKGEEEEEEEEEESSLDEFFLASRADGGAARRRRGTMDRYDRGGQVSWEYLLFFPGCYNRRQR